MRLALYQPDIPQNTAALLRLGACTGVVIDIIEPCGFLFTDAKLRRVGMDYLTKVQYYRHKCWKDFLAFAENNNYRTILLSTKVSAPYTRFVFQENDILLVGRESSGVPPNVHGDVDRRITIPMKEGCRSINVALAAAMVVGEALRQTESVP